MIYVIIGRKKQTELNSTDLRPTSVVIGRQVGCIETNHVPSSWFEKIGRVRPTSVVGRIGQCRHHSDHGLRKHPLNVVWFGYVYTNRYNKQYCNMIHLRQTF
jgi:hypothetical protein